MIVVTVSPERTYIMGCQSTLNCRRISLGDHLVALLWLLLPNLSTLPLVRDKTNVFISLLYMGTVAWQIYTVTSLVNIQNSLVFMQSEFSGTCFMQHLRLNASWTCLSCLSISVSWIALLKIYECKISVLEKVVGVLSLVYDVYKLFQSCVSLLLVCLILICLWNVDVRMPEGRNDLLPAKQISNTTTKVEFMQKGEDIWWLVAGGFRRLQPYAVFRNSILVQAMICRHRHKPF